MSASSHLVEEGGGPTVHEPNAAVAPNVVAANGAASSTSIAYVVHLDMHVLSDMM